MRQRQSSFAMCRYLLLVRRDDVRRSSTRHVRQPEQIKERPHDRCGRLARAALEDGRKLPTGFTRFAKHRRCDRRATCVSNAFGSDGSGTIAIAKPCATSSSNIGMSLTSKAIERCSLAAAKLRSTSRRTLQSGRRSANVSSPRSDSMTRSRPQADDASRRRRPFLRTRTSARQDRWTAHPAAA
ncbi:hypothetical protein AWB69_03477 [Caballeronia udeis]|uniref:Uncharacterized protein n=1 Tax=Caballeronia udeis TaxID=1232866 RepID=A0A158GWE9_9BURK|nr:hypothetical protein AWB69_03477 [Caballeronia udeis]